MLTIPTFAPVRENISSLLPSALYTETVAPLMTMETAASSVSSPFVSACAYTLWGILLSNHPVSQVGIFSCLIPVMGVLLSAFMLQETQQAFSFSSLISLLLIVWGVGLVNAREEN